MLASFNNTYKYEPVMFAVWMEILAAVPETVLWLQANNALAVKNLRGFATVAGIDPERPIFAGFLPKSAHLQRLALADLALDTRSIMATPPPATRFGQHYRWLPCADLILHRGFRPAC